MFPRFIWHMILSMKFIDHSGFESTALGDRIIPRNRREDNLVSDNTSTLTLPHYRCTSASSFGRDVLK